MNTKSYFTIIALCGTFLAFGGSVKASDSSSASNSKSVDQTPHTVTSLVSRKNTTRPTPTEIEAYVEELKSEDMDDNARLCLLLSVCDLPLIEVHQVHNADRAKIIEKIIATIKNVITPILEAFIRADGTMEHSEVTRWVNVYLKHYCNLAVKKWKSHDNKSDLSKLEQSFVESIEDLIALLKVLIPDRPERDVFLRWRRREAVTSLLVHLGSGAGK